MNSGSTVPAATLWYENLSVDPITNIRMAIVEVALDDCGDYYIEQIQNDQASPVSASFSDNRTQANALTLPSMDDGTFVGIWIERTVNTNAVKKAMACDNLYAKHIAEPLPEIMTVQTVADTAGSLNNTYWFLNTRNGAFYVWYNVDGTGTDPAIAGREGIRVNISAGDTADTVAANTNSQLNTLLDPRGEVTSSVDTDTLTITMGENGPVQDSTVETSGFTIAVTQEGVINTLELIEDIDIFINY